MLVTEDLKNYNAINFSPYFIDIFIEKNIERIQSGDYKYIVLGTIEDEEGNSEELEYDGEELSIGGKRVVKIDPEDKLTIFSAVDQTLWNDRFEIYRNLPEQSFDKLIEYRWKTLMEIEKRQ